MKHAMTYILYLGVGYAAGGPLYAYMGVPSWVTYVSLLIVAGVATTYHYLRP